MALLSTKASLQQDPWFYSGGPNQPITLGQLKVAESSGGAICSFMLWYSFMRGEKPLWKRLLEFWDDNTAKTFPERMLNDLAINTTRLTGSGLMPQFALSPSSPLMKLSSKVASLGTRQEFTDFRALLESHVDFSEVASWGPQPKPPVLFLGACNVLTGRLHKFCSYMEPMKIEHLLASACVPTLFPAVCIDNDAYWDGLFSDNSPITALTQAAYVGQQNIPHEIWVIKINPTTADAIPTWPKDIIDRRNELVGNVSLFQGLSQVERINTFLHAGAFNKIF